VERRWSHTESGVFFVEAAKEATRGVTAAHTPAAATGGVNVPRETAFHYPEAFAVPRAGPGAACQPGPDTKSVPLDGQEIAS
jgi:hypothetical protein